MLGFLLFKNSYLNIEGRGQGIFPLLAIFIKFHCGNFVKNCLWTSIGSACCLGKISKWILRCIVSLLKTEAALPSALTEKFLKKFS